MEINFWNFLIEKPDLTEGIILRNGANVEAVVSKILNRSIAGKKTFF